MTKQRQNINGHALLKAARSPNQPLQDQNHPTINKYTDNAE